MAAQLQGTEALRWLLRGEQFVRSSLPDVSAKRKLSSLLLLRGKRMQELVPMLLEVRDSATSGVVGRHGRARSYMVSSSSR